MCRAAPFVGTNVVCVTIWQFVGVDSGYEVDQFGARTANIVSVCELGNLVDNWSDFLEQRQSSGHARSMYLLNRIQNVVYVRVLVEAVTDDAIGGVPG